MATVKQAKRRQFVSRLIWLVAILAVIVLLSFLAGPKVGAVIEGLTPPQLPKLTRASRREWLDQNWDQAMTRKFHHISQGTRTLPLPLSWLLALEEPVNSPFLFPFVSRGKFSDNEYLLRFGFIESETSDENPHGLPIGIATTPYQSLIGINNKVTAVGFTCAACHTAHLTYGDTEYIIEGGPAATDLGQLTRALGAALGQTLISSKLPIFNGRFERFAKNVLKDGAYSDANVVLLNQELEALVTNLASLPATVDIVEGYSRLDALNRIGNQVFALDPKRFDNYVAIDAPVNYPHIWTSSWFDWVQYDGSIMQPLIRNAGEAMGVSADVNTTAPSGQQRFSSSIPIKNLKWIESALKGDSPLPKKAFSGLLSPKWPDSFPPIDRGKAELGAALYQKICKGCHLAPLDSEEIWDKKYIAPVKYYVDGVLRQTPESLLKLKMITLQQIGTDPAQAGVLLNRTVNTAGKGSGSDLENTSGMGIDTEICGPAPAQPDSPYAPPNKKYRTARLTNVPVSDGPAINFGLALGAIVQQVNDAWFAQNYISAKDRPFYEEWRPNCLRASFSYKARPLNGIWATAPFLHNGSIASLMDLLSPPEERPALLQLGDIAFDPVSVGLKRAPNLEKYAADIYNRNGYFILDTSIPGNSNRGHEFSSAWDATKEWDQQQQGVIGPEFSRDERLGLIEYLKTL